MPPPDTDLAARVRAGMAFLDQRLGAGWEEHVDVERLDLGLCADCVIGQLDCEGAFGLRASLSTCFRHATNVMGWERDEVVGYGFDASEADDVGPEYAALTAEWRAQIAARRAGKEGTE